MSQKPFRLYDVSIFPIAARKNPVTMSPKSRFGFTMFPSGYIPCGHPAIALSQKPFRLYDVSIPNIHTDRYVRIPRSQKPFRLYDVSIYRILIDSEDAYPSPKSRFGFTMFPSLKQMNEEWRKAEFSPKSRFGFTMFPSEETFNTLGAQFGESQKPFRLYDVSIRKK